MGNFRVKLPTERTVRLTAGLIMFSYATCHLISHATGFFLLDGIQRIGHDILLVPWRTPAPMAAPRAVRTALAWPIAYRPQDAILPHLDEPSYQQGLLFLVWAAGFAAVCVRWCARWRRALPSTRNSLRC